MIYWLICKVTLLLSILLIYNSLTLSPSGWIRIVVKIGESYSRKLVSDSTRYRLSKDQIFPITTMVIFTSLKVPILHNCKLVKVTFPYEAIPWLYLIFFPITSFYFFTVESFQLSFAVTIGLVFPCKAKMSFSTHQVPPCYFEYFLWSLRNFSQAKNWVSSKNLPKFLAV